MSMDLAIEVTWLTLDKKGLQTLADGDVAEERRPQASVGRRWAGEPNLVSRDRAPPVIENHGECSRAAVLTVNLAHIGHCLDDLPASFIRQFGGRRASGGSQIAPARQ